MATVHSFLDQLITLELQLGKVQGADLASLPKDTRVAIYSVTAMVALLIKALNDNGVLTNAQLSAAVTAARAETWTELPNRVVDGQPVNP